MHSGPPCPSISCGLDEPFEACQRIYVLVGLHRLPVAVFAMYFDVRHLFVAFLCIVASFGQTPAWVHVASCEDCSPAQDDEGIEPPVARCAHGCDHHHGDPPAQSSKEGGEQNNLPHDQDTCATCHSLAGPVGVGWTPVTLSFSEYATDCGKVFSTFIAHQILAAAAQPRGPPQLV